MKQVEVAILSSLEEQPHSHYGVANMLGISPQRVLHYLRKMEQDGRVELVDATRGIYRVRG